MIMPFLLFLSSFGIYLFTLAPSLQFGDSGELITAGASLGIAHPPGYPLYSVLGKLFCNLIPFGNPAYRMNLMSAILASLTLVVLYFVLKSLIEVFCDREICNLQSTICNSAFAVLILGFSNIFWSQAVVSEVFMLNVFFFVLLLYITICPSTTLRTGDLRLAIGGLYLFSFLFGLGLGNHHTLLLALPGFAYILISKLYKQGLFRKSSLSSIICNLRFVICYFLIGFLIYMYLPLRSLRNPALDWDNPETFDKLWQVFARLRYGGVSLAEGGRSAFRLSLTLNQISGYIEFMIHEFTIPGAILGVFGLIMLRSIGIWLLFLVPGIGFIFLANIPITSNTISLLNRFFLLPDIVFAVGIGFGIHKIVSFLNTNNTNKHEYRFRGFNIVITVLLILVGCLFISRNFKTNNLRNDYFLWDYSKNILRSLPDKSIVFLDRADESIFGLSYLKFVEHRRPDLTVYDRFSGPFGNIYGDDYLSLPHDTRVLRRKLVEQEMVGKFRSENPDMPIYFYSNNPQLESDFLFGQQGIVFRVIPEAGKPAEPHYDWQEIYTLRNLDNLKLWQEPRTESLISAHFSLLNKYYLNIKDTDKSFRLFKYLAGTGFPSPDLLVQWGYEYHRLGILDKAKSVYEFTLKLQPENTVLLNNLGAIYEQTGNLDKAVEMYETVINIAPDNADAHYNLAVSWWKKENWNEVIKELKIVLAINPNHPQAKMYYNQAINKIR